MTWRSKLTFVWAIAVDSIIHESEVRLRADNASERGVPLPDGWKTDLNLSAPEPVVDVDALAHSAVVRVREELSLPDATQLDCRRTNTQTHAHTHPGVLTPARAFAQLYLCVVGTPDPAVLL